MKKSNEQKSKLRGFMVGERIETTNKFCNPRCGINSPYHNGYIKIISESLPGCIPGSMITFISDDGEIQFLHEANLQYYTGERYRNGDKVTSSTIEDILGDKKK